MQKSDDFTEKKLNLFLLTVEKLETKIQNIK
jgi:hypothetical protein